MLTVDYRRLGLRPGERLLDVGCGAGRHAYEAVRRGAVVVAYDLDAAEVKDTATVLEALETDGAAPGFGVGWAVNGNVLHLPFPTASFDRVIASEVLEHVGPDEAALAELVRVVRPGGSVAVTVPRWGPELLNWALSDEYHTVPGGHLRIYRERTLTDRMARAGLRTYGRGFAHSLHSPYWWLRCLVGLGEESHPLVRAYHQVLVWDIERTPVVSAVTSGAERLLNPFIGKSLVLYAHRP